jgi:hypothetical protein
LQTLVAEEKKKKKKSSSSLRGIFFFPLTKLISVCREHFLVYLEGSLYGVNFHLRNEERSLDVLLKSGRDLTHLKE